MLERATRRIALSLCVMTSCALGACSGTDSEEENKLVFFKWWTSPGELAALNKLVGVFTAKYPDVMVENAVVTGGPATNLHDRLYDQGLKVGKPPDSYQLHIGAEAKADYGDPREGRAVHLPALPSDQEFTPSTICSRSS